MGTFLANWKNRLLIGGGALGILCLFGLSTCSPPTDTAREAVAVDDEQRCEDLVQNAFNIVQPERLHISSDPSTAASVLNDWLMNCKDAKVEGTPELSDFAKAHLSEEEQKDVAQPRFTEQDPTHMRDCILAREMGEFAGAGATSTLDRVVKVFDYVVRNVALVPPDQALPGNLYSLVLFGSGTAADRAWLFSDILKQQRIDSVVIRSKAEGLGDRLLVAALVDGQAYLFDPELGLPIPSQDDPGTGVLVERPATLAEVRGNAELLRKLDTPGHPYPLNSDALKDVSVELIVHSAYLVPRMEKLQEQAAGDNAAILFEGLDDGSAGPGLVARVAQAGQDLWPRENITVWDHPDATMEASIRVTGEAAQRLVDRRNTFQAPLLFNVDQQSQQIVYQPSKSGQRKTRTSQILGRFDGVIASYQMMRAEAQIPQEVPVDPQLRRINSEAAEDAVFWIGVCQLEQGNDRAAGTTFDEYTNSYPNGRWVEQAYLLRAQSVARRGEFEAASFILERAPANAPQQHLRELLIQRWRSRPQTPPEQG